MAKFALLMGLAQAVAEWSEHTHTAAQADIPGSFNLTPDGVKGRVGYSLTPDKRETGK